jgi:peptidylprolyl isomerase
MAAMSRGPILIVSLCVALALFVAGCGSDDSSTGTTVTEGASTSAGAGDTDLGSKPEVTVPDGPPPTQLEIKDIVEGKGKTAGPGETVSVQYVGVDYETGEQFDASWDRGEPFSFTIGDREVIPGWDKGVRGMKPGGRRELIVPPGLAYGAAGAPPSIGPNATLVFVIDMLSVK